MLYYVMMFKTWFFRVRAPFRESHLLFHLSILIHQVSMNYQLIIIDELSTHYPDLSCNILPPLHYVIVLPYLTIIYHPNTGLTRAPSSFYDEKKVVPERAQAARTSQRPQLQRTAKRAGLDAQNMCRENANTVGVNGLGSGGDICLMNSPSGNCD